MAKCIHYFFLIKFFHFLPRIFPPWQKDEVYLNLVLEYIPETVYKVARQFAKSKQTIPINYIRVSKWLSIQLTYSFLHDIIHSCSEDNSWVLDEMSF